VHDGLADSARHSSVDLNRAGTPLIEIVTEPDFRLAKHAAAFFEYLRELLMAIGANDGNMEEGSLRCDANVSVRRPGEPLGARAEIKNLNSFRFLEDAIDYETARQIEAIEAGERVVQETRLWDPGARRTVSMRSKEEAHDYRYFPEPDLPPLVLTPEFVAEQQSDLPELPSAKRDRFAAQYTLSREHAAVLTASRAVAEYYESVVHAGADAQAAANWVMTEALADAKDHQEQLRVPPPALAQIVALVKGGTLSHQAAKRVFGEVASKGGDPRTVAEALGLVQVADTNVHAGWVTDVLGAHAAEVGRYKKGETKLMAFFIGQVMRASKGKADPKLAQRVLEQQLASAS
jgi:aspartyl-tRNA(Asn)/glutamyl-tRNA(Gln) amidotransferase subunit B